MNERKGTRIDPKTGRMETYDMPPPADLERTRRELRDMLRGNTQFHTDPNAAPPPAPAPEGPPAIDLNDLILNPTDWFGVGGFGLQHVKKFTK